MGGSEGNLGGLRPSPKPVTERDPELVKWVRGQECLVPHCGLPGESCHVRTRNHGDRANVVPLCRTHHQEQHTRGVRTFERRYGLDLTIHAARVWEEFRSCGSSGYSLWG